MSYAGVDPAQKKAYPSGFREPLRGPVRSGASPAAVLATLAICAAGGLIFGSIVGGAWFFVRGRSAQASSDVQASSQAMPLRSVSIPGAPPPSPIDSTYGEAMQIRFEREQTEARAIIEREHAAIQERLTRHQEEMETRHAEIRARMERMRSAPMEFPRPQGFPGAEFSVPFVPNFPAVAPGAASAGSPLSTNRTHATPVERPPLIERPVSVSYSRSVPRAVRLREGLASSIPQTWSDPVEGRLARLQALSENPLAFASEASWFVRRKSTLPEELALRIEETIATFICQADSPDAVTALPRVLSWYGEADLPQLVRVFARLSQTDDGTALLERRQIIVGTLQRYRKLDGSWSDPAAADMLRAMRTSKTVSGHVVPTLETLPMPYCPAMEDLLLEMAFDGTTESTCAQRQALRDFSARERLLDAAIARLESSDEVQREAAYTVLAATEPTSTHADAALGALASAFANESVEPSPLAHAALTLWLNEEHADRFDEFCECDCPIRRTAARAAVGRFEKDGNRLASSAK